MDVDEQPGLGTVLADLVNASQTPAKRRQVGVKPTVEQVTSHAYESGLLPDDLAVLVDLVTAPGHLDQASLGSIVRNLYPASQVSADAVLNIIGCLGHGQVKPSLAVQSLLVRWLILVYHIIDRQAVLSQAYAVLFNLLDTNGIRPQLCHLLALVTRRKHVRPHRIQTLLELSRKTGHDPSLTGLLRVYKNYYPEIIVGDAVRGKASPFKHPDPHWRARLDEIQEAHVQMQRDAHAEHQNTGFRSNHMAVQGTSSRRAPIPRVQTSHAQENSVTLEEIESAESLARNLEKIELPNQLVAVLADPLLQKLLLLRPDGEALERVDSWIRAFIADMASGEVDYGLVLQIVEIIHDYVSNVKHLPLVLLDFFRRFFPSWNGRDSRDEVITILSHVPIIDFHDLYPNVLRPFEMSLLDGQPETQLALLAFYTRLMHRWTILLLSSTDFPQFVSPSITQLIDHVNQLALTLTQTSPTVASHMAILSFYHATTSLLLHPTLQPRMRLRMPASALIYNLLFSHSLAILSQLCALLTEYKQGFEEVMRRPASRDELGRVNVFNGFLIDVCNLLWRGKGFNSTDANAHGCLVPRSLVPTLAAYVQRVDDGLGLPALFGLSHSPAMCLQSIAYLRDLEDAEMDSTDGELGARHAGPVTQQSLGRLANGGGIELSYAEYRSGVLADLEAKGVGGVSALMYKTMKNLMAMREAGVGQKPQ